MTSTRPFTDIPLLSQKHVNGALLVLRIVLGIVFIAHGAQKVFTMGVPGVTEGFTKMGVPMAGLMGPFISYLEMIGGAALVLGIGTRIFALLLMFDMLGAMFTVHLKGGFFMPTGYEFVLILAAVSLALVLAGAGRYSIDAVIADRRERNSGRI